DHAESRRAKPNDETKADTGANQVAAPANLESEINGGETADQTDDEKRRIDPAEQNAAPQTDEDGGVKSVIAPQQNTQHQRGKCVGGEQPAHFWGEKLKHLLAR